MPEKKKKENKTCLSQDSNLVATAVDLHSCNLKS